MFTTLRFTSIPSALLFFWEFSGQISDGQWENARPYNHWEWVCKVDYLINSNEAPGYSGQFHSKKYNLKPWLNLHKKKDYEWADRIYKYAKFASLLSDDEFNKIISSNEHDMNCILEDLPNTKEMTYDEFIFATYTTKSWRKEHYGREILTKELYDKYYESNYSWQDLKRDLYSCHDTVNNYIM